jgi:hypothetical protein
VSSHYLRFSHHPALDRQRSPLLERLLARADGSGTVTDWRADAFRAIAPPHTPMPGVAAAALYAARGSVDAASVFLATPVHYLAEMSDVRLPADGILSLRHDEGEALAADFNRVWNGAAIRLLTGRDADLYCVFEQPIAADTADPQDVLGRHIAEHLPRGAAAPRLRRLMSEIEMWLFEHEVNRARIARAVPALTGLWMWGGGATLTSLPTVTGWTAGDDPFFKVFAVRPPIARGAASRLEVAAGPDVAEPAASGVAVIAAEPGTEQWREPETRWLAGSLAQLRAGRIERLDLSAGERCFSVRAGWKWRVWRRQRPWWEWFA